VPGLLVITNYEAGNNDESVLDEVVPVLAASYDVEVAQTADLDSLADALSHRRGRDLVVVGGDGSLHAVADILHRIGDLGGATVGLIPEGTGNDFARTLGVPLEPTPAAEVIAAGHRCRVDLIIDDADRVVVNAVHAGVGADAGQAARPWKWLGRLGYLVGAFVAGLTARGSKIRVVADGKVLADGTRRLLQVGLGNGAHIGGGVQLTPDADPTDGLADVLVSFAVRPVDRLLYGLHLRRGTHEERHDVFVTRATSVTLTGSAFWCNSDGEISGPLSKRTWTVRRSALTVFCPREP
jgi:diacylglycerol kinase family enzyme